MTKFRGQVTAIAAALAALVGSQSATAALFYDVTVIAPLPGSGTIVGYALNESGQVTGYAGGFGTPGSPNNFAFITGPNGLGLTYLAVPAGVTNANGFGINDSGQVVGSYAVGNAGLGFITAPNGGATTLLAGEARGINANGQVTGGQPVQNGTAYRAYISAPNGGALTDIGTLPGRTISDGLAINATGQVTGASYNLVNLFFSVDERAFFYSNGVMNDLGTLPGDIFSIGNAINGSGQVAGASSSGNGGGGVSRAFVSAPNGGALVDLGQGAAYGINDAGVVVGVMGAGQFGFVYDGSSRLDLNSLIDPALTQFVTIQAAFGINNGGQIVATGRDRRYGSSVAFLLTPAEVCEPTTLGLLGLGLAGLGFARKRKAVSI